MVSSFVFDCDVLLLQYRPIKNFLWTLIMSLLNNDLSFCPPVLKPPVFWKPPARAFMQKRNSSLAESPIYFISSIISSRVILWLWWCDLFFSFRLDLFFCSFLWWWWESPLESPLRTPWFRASWIWRSLNDAKPSLRMFSSSLSLNLQAYVDSLLSLFSCLSLLEFSLSDFADVADVVVVIVVVVVLLYMSFSKSPSMWFR